MNQFDFTIGAHIHCKDGRAGTLLKVVVDPHTHRVVDLIVEKGLLQKKDRVLPVSVVERTEGDDIYLNIASTDLPNYPEYRELEFRVPAPGWEPNSPYRQEEMRHWATHYGLEGYHEPVIPMITRRVHKGIPGNVEAIGRNTPVRNEQGAVGKIDHLLVDEETKEITHIILARGILRHQIVMPIDWVKIVDDEGVLIRGRHADLKQLRQYRARPAVDVLQEVRERLNAAPYDFRDVAASIEHGVVKLRGVVENIVSKRHAEEVARSVQGVLNVENVLDTNTAIVARIYAALESDLRTHLAVIEVINDRGVVTLSGHVASAQIRRAAQEIASRQTGVITVINALEVKPREKEEDWIRPAVAYPQLVAGAS